MTSYNHSITTCKKWSDITLYFFLLRGKAKIKMKKCPAASTRLCVIIDWDYNVTIFRHWSSEQGAVFLDQVVQGPYPPRSFGQNPKEQQLFIVKPSLMAPESVMICWQERHIWPWQPLLQETEMVDGWSLGQLRQKISLYFLLLCSF